MNLIEKLKALLIEAEIQPSTGLGFLLEEGKEARIQCGRSGSFVAMDGKKVTFTKDSLAQLASGFSAEDEHLVKVGHVPIRSDSPHYGSVTALSYDDPADRLWATIVPTPALVRKNREEGFTRSSMELEQKDEGFRFEHLAMLAARKPAISGLSPLQLAAGAGAGTFVFLEEGEDAEPRPELHLTEKKSDPPLDNHPMNKGEKATKPKGTREDTMGEDEKARLAAEAKEKEIEEKEKAFAARIRSRAEQDAKRFLASEPIVKRVGLKLKAKVEKFMVELAILEAEDRGVVKLAGADGKEETTSLYAIAREILEGMPTQLSTKDEKEIVKEGDETDDKPRFSLNTAAGFTADPASVKLHTEIYKEIDAEKAKGNTLSFADGLRRVTARR